jgi:hypothetical protein
MNAAKLAGPSMRQKWPAQGQVFSNNSDKTEAGQRSDSDIPILWEATFAHIGIKSPPANH